MAQEVTHKIASGLLVGETVYWQKEWLPVVQVSRTSEGMRVVYTNQGWYDLIPAHKVVRVKQGIR